VTDPWPGFDDLPPRDIVPRAGLTLDVLRRMNDAAGTAVIVTEPGRVLADVDGVPTAVEPPDAPTTAHLAAAVVSPADLERLGLNRDDLARDYPNIRVLGAAAP
jgi:hypothetical protein